jgi:hypothetical protein
LLAGRLVPAVVLLALLLPTRSIIFILPVRALKSNNPLLYFDIFGRDGG